MRKICVALVVACALALGGCGENGPRPMETVTPSAWPGDSTTPEASDASTPSQEELSAQAEEAYRAFFNEWKRLEREGGAEEPTQIMLDNGAGLYLEGVTLAIREQKETGFVVEGDPPTTRVSPRPGEAELGSDPRLTLAVCEDHTQSWHYENGTRYTGQLLEGTVYLSVIDGRMKVVWANTREVDQCGP